MKDLHVANKALNLGKSDAEITEHFMKWGPSARSAFEQNIKFEEWAALNNLSSEDAERLFGDGTVTEGKHRSTILDRYLLIRVSPDFKEQPPRFFASKFIFNWLVKQHRNALRGAAIKLINDCAKIPDASGWRGWMYEHLALEQLCLVPEWNIVWEGSIDPKKMPWKSATTLWSKHPFYNLSELTQVDPNVVYTPEVRTLTAGDAFVVAQVSQKVILIIFQVTVGSAHSLKHHGLVEIKDQVETAGWKVDEWFVIFVVPPDSSLKLPQNYVTLGTKKTSHVMKVQPATPLQGIH